MSKSKDNNYSITESINTNSQYLKQLEEEHPKLKIENAYLKELRRIQIKRCSCYHWIFNSNIHVLTKAI